ncbi:DNA/RNA-binding protein KIN17 [Candida albicans P57055]|nr:DNA/RNA-binding protein KIN17 [Candida albicans P57055]
MAKAEFGTAKYQSKKLRAAGLQKLKFYCQLCSKQCRDSNGFKNHLSSPSHIKKVSEIHESGDSSKLIETYSTKFQDEFIKLLRINHGTKFINANKFYQEYIRERDHIHMNSTRWRSLTSFIKHLGKNGIVKVQTNDESNEEEEGFNLEIKLIDRTQTLNAYQIKSDGNSLEDNDEMNDDKLLQRQIKRGQEMEKDKDAEKSKTLEQLVPTSASVKLTLKKKKTATTKKLVNAFDENESE